MKFSIIIAAYNLGALICDAIESCVNQIGISKSEYEILTINDGSTDNTLEYINRYKEVENHVIIDKPNGGLSHTRNYGMQVAKGDYIIFLDGDDWLADDALAMLELYLGEYDVVAFPMKYYYNENEQIQRLSLEERSYKSSEFIDVTIGQKRFNIIPAPKKIYRRTFLLDNNIKFVEGILHEDNPFFIDVMSKCNDICYINIPIYFYRQNREGSITSCCSVKNFKGTIKGIEHIKKTSLSKDRNVLFLISNLHVFQAIGNYSNIDDRKIVYKYYRSYEIKKELLKLLFEARFDLKPFVRNLLLCIDPSLLNFVVRKL